MNWGRFNHTRSWIVWNVHAENVDLNHWLTATCTTGKPLLNYVILLIFQKHVLGFQVQAETSYSLYKSHVSVSLLAKIVN